MIELGILFIIPFLTYNIWKFMFDNTVELFDQYYKSRGKYYSIIYDLEIFDKKKIINELYKYMQINQ